MIRLQEKTKLWLHHVAAKKQLNKTTLSAMVGRSRSVISEIMNDRRQFSEAVLNQINSRLSAYYPDDGVHPTSQYKVVQNVCKGSLEALDLRMIVGESGIGKTMALKEFSAGHESVYYLKITHSITQTMFLKQVATALGCKAERYRRADLLDQIGTRLDEQGRTLLLIDECEALSMPTLKIIKHLHNAFEGALGIVIVSVPSLRKRLMRSAGISAVDHQLVKPSNEYTTLFRRCKFFALKDITKEDVELFSMRYGIARKEVIEYLWKRCWNYDYLTKLLKKASEMGVDWDGVAVEDLSKINIY